MKPTGSLIVLARHAEGQASAVNNSITDTPPELHSGSCFVPDGAGQLLIHEDGGMRAWNIDGPAAWPAQPGIRPAGNNDVTVPEEAEGTRTSTETRGVVGTMEQFHTVRDGAGHSSFVGRPQLLTFPSRWACIKQKR
jgi:hypothetical protein